MTQNPATQAALDRMKGLTHKDLLAIPEVQMLAGMIGAMCSTMEAGYVSIALALVFGSITFDAEMQAGLSNLSTEAERAVSFEDRLELFGVQAKIGYDGVAEFCRAESPYGKPQG